MILPEVGGVIFERIFKRVDFPAPFLPIIPKVSPCSTLKLTSFSAQNSSVFEEGFKKENKFSLKLK